MNILSQFDDDVLEIDISHKNINGILDFPCPFNPTN